MKKESRQVKRRKRMKPDLFPEPFDIYNSGELILSVRSRNGVGLEAGLELMEKVNDLLDRGLI